MARTRLLTALLVVLLALATATGTAAAEAAGAAVADPAKIAREHDWFIRATHEAKGVTPVPAAARAEWLRRVTFDLTGLPRSTPTCRMTSSSGCGSPASVSKAWV